MAQYKKDEVREAIVEAALTLFYQNGYLNTRMKDIAREANTSVGNVYRYFNNKKEIYYTIITREFLDSLNDFFIKRTVIVHKKHFNFPLLSEEKSWYENDYFDFLITNRKRLNILLLYNKGTAYEKIVDQIVANMFQAKIELLNQINPVDIADETIETLSLIINKTIDLNIEVLSRDMDTAAMKRLLKSIDYYHQKGIAALWNKMIAE